ncbi:MAG: RsmD family RNA methyltransferase, partial [Peptoniphilus lacrimalis]
MRIIGGDFRGIKLSAPLGLNTRPTLDRIRESLFNILGQYFNGGTVLDLFAGSGCNGLEFLSRGVDFSYFVDNSSQSYNVITSNIEKCRLKDKSKVLKMDYKKALESFLSETFSYIYM